jgi:hypothetical protein
MPRALSVPLRRRLCEMADQGSSPSDIALVLEVSPRSVRRLLEARRLAPDDFLLPRYDTCGRRPAVCQPALDLRREHPLWGAPYIHTVLEEQQTPAPCVRTLQRHLRTAELSPAPPGRRLGSRRRRADAPHQTWQMDACERIRLRTKEEVCWVRAVDEHTGAFLRTRVFPPGVLAKGGTFSEAVYRAVNKGGQIGAAAGLVA